MNKPIVLVVNDDGVTAPGIKALQEALAPYANIWVVAPERERSASGMALTVHNPIRFSAIADQWYSVTGTPVDCVFMAFDQILPSRPDWVITGINRGGNLGSDTLYSGTVAAAHEAALRGVRTMAVSCEAIHSEDSKKSSDGLYYETAGLVAAQLFESRDELNLPLGKILNVNVPSVPATSLKGVVTAALGRRTYHHKMIDYKDPRGRSAFWIGDVPDFIPDDGTDCVAVHEGYVSLTILKPSYEDTVLTNELNHNSLEKRIMERVTKL